MPRRKERQIARDEGRKFYRSSKPCPRGHDSVRLTSNGRCYQCASEDRDKWTGNNKEKVKEMRRRHRENNRYDLESKKLKARYGIDFDEYYDMLEEQGGGCAICGDKESGTDLYDRLLVDHCHETNQVRGLLCFKCNVALGNFKDTPELMKRAIKYVEKCH